MAIIKKQIDNKAQCETCLQLEHPGYGCKRHFLCACDAKDYHHPTVMCPKSIKISNDTNHPVYNTHLTIFDPATPDHDTGIYNTLAKTQRAVGLQTAVFAAVNKEAADIPLHCQNIAILADTAAQRSLITKEAADRLKLPIISEERASILGYGQVKATNQVYKVVEITLGPPKGSDNKKPVIINALVVGGMNPIFMTGISKFALKLKSKGLDMADSRLVNSKSDTVNTDLLIGTDYYDEIVSPRHMSK